MKVELIEEIKFNRDPWYSIMVDNIVIFSSWNKEACDRVYEGVVDGKILGNTITNILKSDEINVSLTENEQENGKEKEEKNNRGLMGKDNLKEEDIEYLSEEQVRSLITRLLFEIEKLKDENESLWYMLEEIEQSNIAGREVIAESLKSLKNFKTAINAKPAEA